MNTKYFIYLLLGVLFLSSCNSDENIVTTLDAPVNVKGEWFEKQIKLSWEEPKYTDELEYEVFLKEGLEFKLITKTRETSCIFTQHSVGYNIFKVRARSINNSTLCSDFSDEISVIVEYEKNKKDILALYDIMRKNTNIELQWEFNFDPDNSESPIDIRNCSEMVVFENMNREQRVTGLNLSNQNQSSLDFSDISKLEELTILGCSNNQLSSLDISKNTKLAELYCDNNQLTSLNISKNTKLTRIFCQNNQLSSLEVSKSIALTVLLCDNNQLPSLNVSGNRVLELLSCGNNQLSSLDVSKNTILRTLDCGNNQLPSLDVSKNATLGTLYCDNNQLKSLDVSENTKLTVLSCINNLFQKDSVWILKSFIDESQSIEQNQKGYLLPAKNSTIYRIVDK